MQRSCSIKCHESSTLPTRRCIALCNARMTYSNAALSANQIALTTRRDAGKSQASRIVDPSCHRKPAQRAPARKSNMHRLVRA